MYNKYVIILIIILLIILKRLNIIILGIIIYITWLYIFNTKNKYDKIVEKMYCRKSDIHNPMGNVLLYTNENELDYNICPNQNTEKNLRFNIYNDRSDLHLIKNNVRPFITMPSLYYPNDIDNVKHNLYYFNKSSCKLNGVNCTYNEDVKYHKSYFLDNKIKTNT